MAIILPSGFVITNNEPVDSRLSVADSASRFSLSVNNVYEGITVYERDTNIIYVLTDATAPSSASSWQSLISNTSSSIATSASYSVTSSYALSGTGLFSGSFSGSFQGNGSGLTDIPASGIVGLNLSQIASGSATASISPNLGLQINTNTTISASSDFVLRIHGANDLPWAFGVFNDTYNPAQAALAGWVNNTGEANIGTEVNKPLQIYTDSNYNNPTLVISSSGITSPIGITAQSFTGSLFGTASYSAQNLSSSYAETASYAPAYLPLTGGTISGDLTVIGTASFAYTTASIVQVGSNVIILNTNYPAVRFGGISVVDSGSFGNASTGSLLWDSLMNRWVYANPSGSSYDGGILIAGPKNTSGLGNETGMTEHFVAVGQGTDHIQSGTIFNSGSITQVTGSLFVTAGVTGSFTGSFTGDGAGLTNIPATGIVGLNLSQISSGSVSASISPANGLQINTNVTATSFTGSFSGSGAGLYDIFPVTTDAQILISTGSVLAARSVTGDIAITNAGVTTIQTGAVTFSKIQTLSQAALIGATGSAGGVVQEIPIIEAYVPTGSAFTALLENTANWDINGVYIGSTITGTYQGQSHLNNDYWFTAVADNNWIRLIRG